MVPPWRARGRAAAGLARRGRPGWSGADAAGLWPDARRLDPTRLATGQAVQLDGAVTPGRLGSGPNLDPRAAIRPLPYLPAGSARPCRAGPPGSARRRRPLDPIESPRSGHGRLANSRIPDRDPSPDRPLAPGDHLSPGHSRPARGARRPARGTGYRRGSGHRWPPGVAAAVVR